MISFLQGSRMVLCPDSARRTRSPAGITDVWVRGGTGFGSGDVVRGDTGPSFLRFTFAAGLRSILLRFMASSLWGHCASVWEVHLEPQ